MSSYYTEPKIELHQLYGITKALLAEINSIKAQILQTGQNDVGVSSAANIKITAVFNDEDTDSMGNGVYVSEKMPRKHTENARNVLDFSSLLEEKHRFPSEIEQEIKKLVDSIDLRAVLSERDKEDKERILSEVSKTLDNDAMDIEDKLKHLKMRINSYLQCGTRAAQVDYQQLENEYGDYCALCQLLGEKPVETLPEKVSKAKKTLMEKAEKQKQDEYIMDSIEEIMRTLGCSLKDSAVLDHTEGQIFSVDGQPLCDVFVGGDGLGIMFEPVAKAQASSVDKRHALEESVNSVCSMYDKIEEMALEKGIALQRVYALPASVDSMFTQNNLQTSDKSKQRKSTQSKQLKARTMED